MIFILHAIIVTLMGCVIHLAPVDTFSGVVSFTVLMYLYAGFISQIKEIKDGRK